MNENKTNINWFPGHMAKTRKELKNNMNLIDIVYEVIDARMPISSKVIDIDDIIKDKPKILVVTKYDLCDKKVTDNILKRYNDYQIVKCDLINGNLNELMNKTKVIADCINNERIKKNMLPRKVRVLVIGAPNVGKSTLINRLVGKKAVQTGNTPGVTRSIGWIRISNDIELMDSPGILWPKIENQEVAHNLAAFSSIREDILNKDDIACYILKKLYELYPDKLKERYGIDKIDDDFSEAFDIIGIKRGKLSKGGIVDYEKVTDIILNDFKNAAFGKVTFDKED